jgi:tight adherence protein C
MNELLTALADSRFVVLALVFGAVFVAVIGVGVLVGRNPVSERLGGGGKGDLVDVPAAKLRQQGGRWIENPLVKQFARRFTRGDDRGLSTLRRRLVQAGYMQPWALTGMYAARMTLAVVLPLTLITVVPLLAGGLSVNRLLAVAMLSGLVGLYLPTIWITHRIDARQQAIRESLPDSLDMMLVCVEAGLGLDAALARVAQEIERAHPLLAFHLQLVGLELRAGRSRDQALRSMGERVGLDEVNSLVTVVLQSEALGTSLGQALRVYADDMRKKRLMKAEEKANMLPVKLSIPLVIFVLPALMIVMMSPAVIKVIRVILPVFKGTAR